MLEIILYLALAALPVLGVMWWLDRLIKRSQQTQRLAHRRGFEVKTGGTGEQPVPPPTRLKPPGPPAGAGDTRKGDHG